MADLERWRSIADSHDYLVSDEGNVRRLLPDGTWRVVKAWRNPPKNYYRVDVWTTDDETGKRVRRQRYVHQLVLEAFVGPRPVADNGDTYDGDHIDGDRRNNTLPNLRWRLADQNRWDWHGQWKQEEVPA
jgi:hypothetical protein